MVNQEYEVKNKLKKQLEEMLQNQQLQQHAENKD